MKFNSQICTTKEQSERLLALGLKAETADMHHYQYAEGGRWNIEARPSIAGYNNRLIPAWSFHRLWELVGIKRIELDSKDEIRVIYDGMIDKIESLIKEDSFNKEYLE